MRWVLLLFHFTDKETETLGRLGNLPRVTQLVRAPVVWAYDV